MYRWPLFLLLLLLVGGCGSEPAQVLAPDGWQQDAPKDVVPETVTLPDATPEVVPDWLSPADLPDLPPDIPAPGDFGKPCAGNEDCESGFCLQVSEEESVCTITCVEECPKDWHCKGMETPPDWTFICVPPGGNLCKPCTTDADCLYQGDRCLPIGESGTFCGIDCGNGQECPLHTTCTELTLDDQTVSQCLPDTGSCICTFELNGTTRECSVENEFGKCYGDEFCDGPAGWTACDAPVPAAESCDGFDEDCDGQVDEGLADQPCQVENEFGTCAGTKTCEGEAGWVCDAQVPEAESCDGKDNDCDGEIDEDYQAVEESCDGIDNDCDGKVDEGFADTDGDDLADCIDEDDDNDGVNDDSDNCPELANDDQADLDDDGLGDLCDPDIDGDASLNELDCAPLDGSVHPGADEACNGVDDNCNSLVDEGYPDPDSDQLANCIDDDDDGDLDPDATDCAPLDPTIFTGADEFCDGVDNDCNGVADEGCPASTLALQFVQAGAVLTTDDLVLDLVVQLVAGVTVTNLEADLVLQLGQ